jgi:group I intron endonuclease
MIGIYEIRNKLNGKRYVGSSRSIQKRWARHISMLNRNKHDNIKLQRAWLKYGESAFEFNVLEQCAHEELLERETCHIERTKSATSSGGYNIAPVAHGGQHWSEEMRAQISAKLTGRKVGPRSEESRRNMSLAMTGKKFGESRRKRMSDAAKAAGRKPPPSTPEILEKKSASMKLAWEKRREKGMGTPSEETRAKLSSSLKGRVFSEDTIAKLKTAAKSRVYPKTRDKEANVKTSETMKAMWERRKAENWSESEDSKENRSARLRAAWVKRKEKWGSTGTPAKESSL